MLNTQEQYTIISTYLLQFVKYFLCVLLFAKNFKKKEQFPARVIVAVLAELILYGIVSALEISLSTAVFERNLLIKIICRELLTLTVLFFLFFCYDEGISECIFCWCMIISSGALISKSFPLILNLFGVNDKLSISFFNLPPQLRWIDAVILLIYHIAGFIIFGTLFQRRQKIVSDKKTSSTLAVIAFVLVLGTYALSISIRPFEDIGSSPQLTMCTRFLMIICNAIILWLCLGLNERNKMSQDLAITEQLLIHEKRQYEMSRENVETINRRCHDLKHRLDTLDGTISEKELSSLREAIQIYDTTIKTGSDILDAILYEKQLYCEKKNIRINCMANGKIIQFMSPSHLYSLFGNAIDNAIEAIEPISDPQKRIIDISVRREGSWAVIETGNYYTGDIQLEDNMPVTTKKDKNTHGYGMKSMQHVVDCYHGKMTAHVESGIFILTIMLPI